MRQNLTTVLFFLLSAFLSVHAQTGSIQGAIKDATNGEELIGAIIKVQGTGLGAPSDATGNFRIDNIKEGTYTLEVNSLSYKPKVLTSIAVTAGKTTTVNVDMEQNTSQLAEVTITAKGNRETEQILLLDQKKAVIATQAIGAQELSRKGVSDAEGAVAKISGVSKRDGVKNVFVRGLGDRYNTTTLNGFAIPSEDPEFKNISLDFFTSDIIQSVDVNKAFSSSMNGDVGGAIININSKELVDDQSLQIGISTGINSQVPGSDFYLPGGLNSLGYATASNGPIDLNSRPEDISRYTSDYSFNTSLNPVQKNPLLNGGLSIAGGSKFLGKHRFYVMGSMDNKYHYQEGVTRLITATNPANPFRDFDYQQSTRSASHMLAGNLEFNLNKGQLRFNSLYLHTAAAAAYSFYGKETELFQKADEFNSEGHTRRLQVNDNTAFINQLIWSGDLSDRIKYNVGAAVNRVIGQEPDRRIIMLPSVGDGSVELGIGEGRVQRFNYKITETALLPKANLQYALSADPDKVSYVEVGYDGRISTKDFSAPIYNYIWDLSQGPAPVFPLSDINLNPHLNQESLNNGHFMLEQNLDVYDVERMNHGAYVDMVHKTGDKLTLNAGLRADDVYMKINYNVNRGANQGSNVMDKFFLSPSFNAKYELDDKNHLRTGISRTYTLPQDKELSPFIYQGIFGKENGNPNLKPSTNYNFDLKWDFYPTDGEQISVNAFYKHIQKPIARVDQGNSAGLATYDNVADHAVAAGIEVEVRKSLMNVAEKHRLNAGLNASYIHTRIDDLPSFFAQNTSSTLEGAAPYILNADLTYNLITNRNTSLTSAVVLNYLSDKVHTIGTRGYTNLIEKGITTLDFITTMGLNDHLKFNIKAKNLLNPAYRLTREGAGSDTNAQSVTIGSYKRGAQFDLGVTYQF
ncbi:TonB-dependent receptor [Pontibacter indicus]|uniref:Outer membrane receptor proteins, mostly Fe transport n=1 Tax=Pontibacter indicus TaxID=1317125 RepID=A0A1R3XHA7_9BACT|nr:TonB-dependent receptor [Pontibacter indicus]SIT90762.1 Outer membrane receptor proteins, mostly Fe transport [Pontibacter indicus]